MNSVSTRFRARQEDGAGRCLSARPSAPSVARAGLTRRAQDGEPGFGKIVGFYARPLLRTCRLHWRGEAATGDVVVARTAEAVRVAARLRADVALRTPELTVLRVR